MTVQSACLVLVIITNNSARTDTTSIPKSKKQYNNRTVTQSFRKTTNSTIPEQLQNPFGKSYKQIYNAA